MRWFRRERLLNYFRAAEEQITQFLKNKQKEFRKLKGKLWNYDKLTFLKGLNLQIQGKITLYFEMFAATEAELKLFKNQLLKYEISHFFNVICIYTSDKAHHDKNKYVNQINVLIG